MSDKAQIKALADRECIGCDRVQSEKRYCPECRPMNEDLIERVAKAIRDQNRRHMQLSRPHLTFERDALTGDDIQLARAAISAMQQDAAMNALVAEGQRCDAMRPSPQEAAKVLADECFRVARETEGREASWDEQRILDFGLMNYCVLRAIAEGESQ